MDTPVVACLILFGTTAAALLLCAGKWREAKLLRKQLLATEQQISRRVMDGHNDGFAAGMQHAAGRIYLSLLKAKRDQRDLVEAARLTAAALGHETEQAREVAA